MRLANHPCRTLEGHMQAVAEGRARRTRGDVHRITLGIARGVAHVHDCGIVHRDLKRASRESNVGGGTREILFTCFFCYL